MIYGIPNCQTVKKARSWLSEHGYDIPFHDFKKQGISSELLQHWVDQVGWEILLNKKGSTWRALDESIKTGVIDAKRAIECMLLNPSMIKRPILVWKNQLIVGFDPVIYQETFA